MDANPEPDAALLRSFAVDLDVLIHPGVKRHLTIFLRSPISKIFYETARKFSPVRIAVVGFSAIRGLPLINRPIVDRVYFFCKTHFAIAVTRRHGLIDQTRMILRRQCRRTFSNPVARIVPHKFDRRGIATADMLMAALALVIPSLRRGFGVRAHAVSIDYGHIRRYSASPDTKAQPRLARPPVLLPT